MKRRVLPKTTPFHAKKKKKKKKKKGTERYRFERHCSPFFFLTGRDAEEGRKMVFLL